MTPLVYVALAHLLYDFHWQGDFIATWKAKSRFILGVHALTWALLIYVVLAYFGLGEPWKLLFLLGTHYFIDWAKAYGYTAPLEPMYGGLWLDQALHMLTLVVVVAL